MWAGLHLGWKFWVATFVQWTKNNIQIQTYLTQDFMSLRETTLHAMYMNMIQTACRNKEIDIWCFLPGQINWTCLAQFFSVSDFKIWRKKKSDLNYIHSHEFFISVIIFFLIWKYIYFYKRNWTMEFLILKWEKGLFFKKIIKLCLAYNLAAVYQ